MEVKTTSTSLRERLRRELGRVVFDRRLGISTTGGVEVQDLGYDDPHYHGYQPAPWRTLNRILPPDEVSSDDVFADIGSGKGRIVILAARRYACRRVVGVELSLELHRLAEENLRRAPGSIRAARVELVNADALEWPVPDDLTIAFLFNPFTDAVFERLVTRLLASLARAPRRFRLIYQNPTEEAALLATGRARPLRTVTHGTRGNRIANTVQLYELW
jgi:SAM-dependent methyltransferase